MRQIFISVALWIASQAVQIASFPSVLSGLLYVTMRMFMLQSRKDVSLMKVLCVCACACVCVWSDLHLGTIKLAKQAYGHSQSVTCPLCKHSDPILNKIHPYLYVVNAMRSALICILAMLWQHDWIIYGTVSGDNRVHVIVFLNTMVLQWEIWLSENFIIVWVKAHRLYRFWITNMLILLVCILYSYLQHSA